MNTTTHHLDEHELAARLNISVLTIRGWRRTGTGPRFRKYGSAVRYAVADVEDFEKAASRTSTSDPGPAK
jgi:hypothetical protein